MYSKRQLLYPFVANVYFIGEKIRRRHIKRLAMASLAVVIASVAALRRPFSPPLSPLN